MSRKAKIELALCLLILLVLAFGITLISSHRHGLRAELRIESADIGIPGITKAYEARLVNRSLWPIRVQYCDFMTDAMTRERSVPYTVERWDGKAKEWQTVVRANGEEFCRPYPLGIVRATVTSRLLWPGQSLSTGEEATAAIDGFSIGDKVRFVIYTGAGRAQPSQIATDQFIIDEHRTNDVPLRIKH